MSSITTGQNVLATINNQSSNQGYRPRLIEFYGYEGEDFRHFQEILESYFAISNTNSDSRKLIILKSQLRRAAKVYFERVIIQEKPDITYDQVMEKLKNYYITPELIQSYELEFNEMYQGEQEHPQIFLARLREASDLANINNEALIQSRFRAGLLREIKQFCIQSSARSFQEWTNHAEGWWNANRPRKIAMVDNPFIPRNINSALIYQDDNTYNSRQILQNHNIELIDTDERPNHFVPINNVRTNGNLDTLQAYPQVVVGPHQLTTMEVTNRSNNQSYLHHMSGNKGSQSMYPNQQEDFLSLIQKTIRMELNNQQYQTQQPTRNYYRRNRFDNYQVPNYNGNDGYHKNDYNDYNNFNGPRASNNYNRNNNRYNNRNNYNNEFNRNYNNNDIRANSDRNDTTNRSRFQPQNDNNQRQPAKN